MPMVHAIHRPKPIHDSLSKEAREFLRLVALQISLRMIIEHFPVTHPLNFRRPQHVIHWMKAAHVIMRWSFIRTGNWIKIEQLQQYGHLKILFGALEELGIHLTGKQKRKLLRDYQND